MSTTRYTPDHTWARWQSRIVAVGLTPFALGMLGPVTALRMPRLGQHVDAETACLVIETVKAASDACAPVAGRVTRINLAVSADPDLVNQEPEGAGWLYEMAPDDPGAFASLMDAAAYSAFIQAL